MNRSEDLFVRQLTKLGKEQAHLNATSPLPEWLRPLAALVGEKPWQTLLITSFFLSSLVSLFTFSLIWKLFNQGVLAWLLN